MITATTALIGIACYAALVFIFGLIWYRREAAAKAHGAKLTDIAADIIRAVNADVRNHPSFYSHPPRITEKTEEYAATHSR